MKKKNKWIKIKKPASAITNCWHVLVSKTDTKNTITHTYSRRIHISLKVATYTNVSQETQKWSTALRIHFKCSNIFELWMSDWFAKLNSTKIEQWWCFFRKKIY